MNQTLNIRSYQITDEQSVIQLWQDCHLVVPWNDPHKDIQRKLNVDADLFLVGALEGIVVATVMGGYEGHRGWINYLAVSPPHRRKGFAKQMMNRVEQLLKEKGCPKINLQVRETNQEVIEFYEAIGYKDDHVISFGKRLEKDD